MPSVLAIVAHPDDIEFLMAGTLLLLRERGWQLHYFNLCDGSLGSTKLDAATCRLTRLGESQRAAEVLGAQHYPPIERDLELTYSTERLRQIAAVVRQSEADVVLTHSPIDYMEDHQNAARLAATAAFARGMPNFITQPETPPYFKPVVVYHAQPHGHRTPLGEWVQADFWVDVESVYEQKQNALQCHVSQHEWLDASQGMSDYLKTLREFAETAGRLSGRFLLAEGWRRRVHWGYASPEDDPLRSVLADVIVSSPDATL